MDTHAVDDQARKVLRENVDFLMRFHNIGARAVAARSNDKVSYRSIASMRSPSSTVGATVTTAAWVAKAFRIPLPLLFVEYPSDKHREAWLTSITSTALIENLSRLDAEGIRNINRATEVELRYAK